MLDSTRLKKTLIIVGVISIVFFIWMCKGKQVNVDHYIGMDSATIENSENSDIQEEITWEGSYEASTFAGRTYGGTGICFELFISIEKNGTDYRGIYEVSGYQTYDKKEIKGLVSDEPEVLNILIDEESQSEYNDLKKNTKLCSIFFDKRSKSFTVKWSAILGELINENSTFSKISNVAYASYEEMRKDIYDYDYDVEPENDESNFEQDQKSSNQTTTSHPANSNYYYVPQSSSNIPAQQVIEHGTRREPCLACGGTGKGRDIITYSPNYTGDSNDAYCSICGYTTSKHSHRQEICNACYGKRYIEIRY